MNTDGAGQQTVEIRFSRMNKTSDQIGTKNGGLIPFTGAMGDVRWGLLTMLQKCCFLVRFCNRRSVVVLSNESFKSGIEPNWMSTGHLVLVLTLSRAFNDCRPHDNWPDLAIGLYERLTGKNAPDRV